VPAYLWVGLLFCSMVWSMSRVHLSLYTPWCHLPSFHHWSPETPVYSQDGEPAIKPGPFRGEQFSCETLDSRGWSAGYGRKYR
jgi:hypothetical protein